MQASCPRCATRLDVPASGTFLCERCRRPFAVYLARPPQAVPAPVPAPAAALEGDARCAGHTNNPATGVCERCGDFMCSLCTIPVEGRSYCARCFDLMQQRGSFAMTQQAFKLPQTALTLALLSLPLLICRGIGLVLAIVALVLGASALRQIARQPELPGRNLAIAALVVAGLSVLISVGALVFFFLAAGFTT